MLCLFCRVHFVILNRSYVKNFCVNTAVKRTAKEMKVLNVAEKNDAAKNIASFLSSGRSRWRDGYSVYNKIYEFERRLWNQNCQMIMTSVSGHLLTHEFVGTYNSWRKCHPLSLFDVPIIKHCIEKNSVMIKRTLEREVRNCQALIIWTDCDREGENIGFQIIEVCKRIVPNINVYRAVFSEITQASVDRALENLTRPNQMVSDAVEVRSKLDLRIGAAFTRFQTLRLQKIFPQNLADLMISYGSCQFPTLAFVVERFFAIQNFVPEPYWKIQVEDIHDDIAVKFRWARGKLFEEMPCITFFDMCKESNVATVEKITKKPASKWRPFPLDTIELGKQGCRILRMNAKKIMQTAEKLYTQGLISYPRTETNIFPKELNLNDLVQNHVESSVWGTFARRVLDEGIMPRQGRKSDHAHPPIHPIKFTNSLSGDEARVYEFIVRHFLACLSKNAEGHETIVDIDVAGEKFRANGLVITKRNYLDIYIYDRWQAKEIHVYQEGQVFQPTDIKMLGEQTSPPPLLTEADLIALMDKHGIGTDATHAEHIETLKTRHYIGLKDDRYLLPGKLGTGLIMGYDRMGVRMTKPNLRAELENDLKLICEGQADPEEVLQRHIKKYRELFKTAMEQVRLLDEVVGHYISEEPNYSQGEQLPPIEQTVNVLKCPKCNSDMILKPRREINGKYIGCMNFPNCKNAIWFPASVEDVEILEETCTQCPGNIHKLKLKFKSGAYPIYGSSYACCIGGCEMMLNGLLAISVDAVRGGNSANDSGYGSQVRPNSRITQERTDISRPRQRPNNSRETNPRHAARPAASQSSVTRTATSGTNSRANEYNSNISTNATGASNRRRPNTQRNDDNNQSRIWGTITEDDVILCNCNQQAVRLTVRKAGVNQGRIFYKCSKPQGTGCNFFQWETDRPASEEEVPDRFNNQNTRYNPYPNPPNQNRGNSWGNDANSTTFTSQDGNRWTPSTTGNDIQCTCRRPAVKLTVYKDGPNKGRQFYSCPQEREPVTMMAALGVRENVAYVKWKVTHEGPVHKIPWTNMVLLWSYDKYKYTEIVFKYKTARVILN
ncbi:DNA topoisomerase 3-alpha isoform X2 [Cephus cinctus]|uniref:DNA topoisomerase n=1 Tax=Cephus cinctus TaxID=211228 RepID=A0AAJ7RC33_CEPCN|nr:DNA topoisomerase 3-alpha isoform X2 [Cephus cinctus]